MAFGDRIVYYDWAAERARKKAGGKNKDPVLLTYKKVTMRQSAWCKKLGVPPPQFYRWRKMYKDFNALMDWLHGVGPRPTEYSFRHRQKLDSKRKAKARAARKAAKKREKRLLAKRAKAAAAAEAAARAG